MNDGQKIRILLCEMYGEEKADFLVSEIGKMIKRYKNRGLKREIGPLFSEKDIVLITYGDSLQRKGEKPLNILHHFAISHLKDIISTIHILPCYPWTSDDGFSVLDYNEIDPGLGTWEDVRAIAGDFKLMLDYVVNHISAQSPWMKKYLAGEEGYCDLAIEVDPKIDLSKVTRPRALPLLTPFLKDNGEEVYLWTTFSTDQVDLNFKSSDVLLKMAEILIHYASEGASILRLDAIAYLWKEIGTNCIHLPKTHKMVKLLRLLFNAVRENSIILTETNVPHRENISYFGNGDDEAQMVYNFTLPPLLLYSFVAQDTRELKKWARTLNTLSQQTTFFNFTASHDGIGVRPLEGIIPVKELDKIIQVVEENHGYVSYKRNSDGSQSPYELNLTYIDAFLWKKDMNTEQVEINTINENPEATQVKRFLASQAIQMVLPGVPAVYIHSLLGSHNWTEGVKKTGRPRTINREKLNIDSVMAELEDKGSFRYQVFSGYSHLLRVRQSQSAFHPNAAFEIPDIHPGIFPIIRKAENQTIYALTNITSQPLEISLEKNGLPKGAVDLLTGKQFSGDKLKIESYEAVWLTL